MTLSYCSVRRQYSSIRYHSHLHFDVHYATYITARVPLPQHLYSFVNVLVWVSCYVCYCSIDLVVGLELDSAGLVNIPVSRSQICGISHRTVAIAVNGSVISNIRAMSRQN